jgi:hypothetical protein
MEERKQHIDDLFREKTHHHLVGFGAGIAIGNSRQPYYGQCITGL